MANLSDKLKTSQFISQSASAYHADIASVAVYATFAGSADRADYSTQATSAYQSDLAKFATIAVSSAVAGTADKAGSANFASQALSAGYIPNFSVLHGVNSDTKGYTGIQYFNSGASNPYADGALYQQAYQLAPTTWGGQIMQDYRTGKLAVRGLNNTAWTTWLNIIDSSTIGSQSVFLSAQSVSAYKADILATARTINGVSFNGSANINIEDRQGTPIASATTTTIGTVGLGETIHITGSATITSLGVSTTGTRRTLIFDSAGCVLTHNPTILSIPGSGNHTTKAGDVFTFICENGASGYWKCVSFALATVTPLDLFYLDGVSGNIQQQLVDKEPRFTILPVTKGGTGLGTLTQDVIYKGNAANTLAVSTISENASGRVLVGATDDGSSKFQVNGQSSITNHTAASVRGLQLLNNTNSGTATGIDLAFATHDGTAVSYCSAIGATNISNTNGAYGSRTTYLTATGSGGLLLATTSPSSSIRFLVGSDANAANERMRIDKLGNVGIGTTTPLDSLHILSNSGNAIFGSPSAGYAGMTFSASAISLTNYSVLGDGTSTFINRPAGGSIYFREANNSQMAIIANGNVGIGTTTPKAKLDILSTSNINPSLTYDNGAYLSLHSNASNELAIGQDATSPFGWWLQARTSGSTSDELLLNPMGGNVGIGIRSPTSLLHTYSGSVANYLTVDAVSGYHSAIQFSSSGTSQGGLYKPASTIGELRLWTTNYNEAMCWKNGKVGIGTNIPAVELAIAKNDSSQVRLHLQNSTTGYTQTDGLQLGLDSSANAYLWNMEATDLNFGTSGLQRMQISPTGNICIGGTNDTYKLEVVGSFAATTKSFIITHPTKKGMKLRYGSLEGPENGIYVRGKLKGSNKIELPEYWSKLVDPNSITVSLTPIGTHQKLFVKAIDGLTIHIGNDNFLTSNIECFYVVYGERCDVEKLVCEIDA